MKLGLYMATQWRQGVDLGPELKNLIEQVRVAKASGLASLMVGQHFVRLHSVGKAAAGRGDQSSPGEKLFPVHGRLGSG